MIYLFNFSREEIIMISVEKVAQIARLELSEKEKVQFQIELEKILEAFRILDQAEDAKPSFHPVEIKDVFREDDIKDPLSQKQALENSKNNEKGYIKAPRAV